MKMRAEAAAGLDVGNGPIRPGYAERGTVNSLFVIHPYMDAGRALVFDDPDRGLVKEPFVAGSDLILIGSAVRSGIKDPTRFTLVFSSDPFPGHTGKAERLGKGEAGIGDWYSVGGAEGWLCPALLKYFDAPPANIYFQIKECENA